jgi:Protein of unknown function (DUF1549)/Protein of unknown function (DUF1553)/Planctomycete cytochrome C
MHWSIAGRNLLYAATLSLACVGTLFPTQAPAGTPDKGVKAIASPDFNREVRPILSSHCLKCHGPDDKQRKAGLRLDQANYAVKLAKGSHAPESALVIQRILSHGADIMPPVTANKPLTPLEIDILKRWAAAGARYEAHWAFVPPIQRPLPAVHNTVWARNPIDRFILAEIERAGLKPSPEADRTTLVRRLYLDLIGIPPTVQQQNAFLADRSADAYERLVDHLLASPHYGERWARKWLDLARYADTNGYEKDRPRNVWPYRDWVINALNKDMPFDQFTIEQIAGDMLPNATPSQKIATGFHRNTMLNEEGGIDPLEFRFYSMTDRMATTGTTWLGLTTACAQCHSHKYDPITHKDYYRMMACMDNTEEVSMDVPDPAIKAKRDAVFAEADRRESHLAEKFGITDNTAYTALPGGKTTTVSGAVATPQADGSTLISGTDPESDTYTVTVPVRSAGTVDAIRLETLTDPTLGNGGPGRTPHGNFVLSHFTATVREPGSTVDTPVKFVQAISDISQDQFPAVNAISGGANSGWAVAVPGKMNANHQIAFYTEKPVSVKAGTLWTFRLEMNYGGHHTIGKFRISSGLRDSSKPDSAVKARAAYQAALAAWIKDRSSKTTNWQIVRPSKMEGGIPRLNQLADGSIYVTGDQTKLDVYTLTIPLPATGRVTAIRIEALPDSRLPGGGPGRVFYEGSAGDFFLSELTAVSDGKPVAFSGALQNGGDASKAIDGNKQTGWSIGGRQGRSTTAIFKLKEPLQANSITLRMEFEQYYSAPLGKFRVSVTSDTGMMNADIGDDAERALRTPESARTQVQNAAIEKQFLATAPELNAERDAIAQLRNSAPAYPTCLVFRERPADNPRKTFIHHRGEFLTLEEEVTPGIPGFLSGQKSGAKYDRLSLARWLVSNSNPLTARVTMNRQWAILFGRGIVKTTEDFGYQGDPPTNQPLLDWLACEFVKRGWSLKQMHRLIVTSATYRQSSRITPQLIAKDPENRLLARAPRIRLEAEQVRDAALSACGLLSEKIGGPSVFPPQPAGVTSEGAYGALSWNVSTGEDRYRRGLYTFSKRTAPYAMFQTFDGPSGEICVARREVSDTPLQALTLLNDQVFMETAQAEGARLVKEAATDAERARLLFKQVLARTATPVEEGSILAFVQKQKARIASGELKAQTLCGLNGADQSPNLNDRAAWTVAARAVLNLDEFITRQ